MGLQERGRIPDFYHVMNRKIRACANGARRPGGSPVCFLKPKVLSCGNGFHSYWLILETGNKNDGQKMSRVLAAPVCSGESDPWVEIWRERLHSRSSPVPEVLWVHEGSSPLKNVYCPASCFFGGRRDNALRRSIDLLYLSVIK